VAEVPGRKRGCDLCRSTFRSHAIRDADWCRHLAVNFLVHALCLASVGGSCRRAAARDCHYDPAKSKLWESAVLLVALYRGSCDLAAPFKSFKANARQRATLYSEMKIGKTAILGAGAWGTALAWLWGKNGRPISLWGHNGPRIARMQKKRENSDYLPGIKLPPSVNVTSDLRDCAGADLIVFVTPSIALREIATRFRKFIASPDAVLLSCPNGFEHWTGMQRDQ